MTGPPAFRPGEAPGPQGTPSTFKEVTSTTAPRHQAPCAPGEAPPAALPPAAGPATPRQTPGPPSGHPAPTSEGASPLVPRRAPKHDHPRPPPRTPPAPGPRPPASRTPPCPGVPGAPRAPLLGRAAPHPSAPGPLAERPPGSGSAGPEDRAPPPAALTVSPAQLAGAHTLQLRPATSAPRRPETPPSARDSPGHPRTDPHTGAIFRSQARARPELVPARARAHCSEGLGVPPPASPFRPFPSAPRPVFSRTVSCQSRFLPGVGPGVLGMGKTRARAERGTAIGSERGSTRT